MVDGSTTGDSPETVTRFLHARDGERDGDGRIQSKRDANAFANERPKTGQHKLELVLARCNGRKAIDAFLVRDCRERADLRGGCRLDGHARQRAAAVIDDLSADAAC